MHLYMDEWIDYQVVVMLQLHTIDISFPLTVCILLTGGLSSCCDVTVTHNRHLIFSYGVYSVYRRTIKLL